MHHSVTKMREARKIAGRVFLNAESRILNPTLPESRIPNPESCFPGFTLFEVLLSITLIGLLMLALMVGLRVANRAWRTGEARLRFVHTEAERNDFIIQQVSSLVPYRIMTTDPHLPGVLTVLEARADCLRFISTYSSVYRGRTGLVLVEYGIVEASRGNVELLLRETPVADNNLLYHQLILSVANDPDTGDTIINYQPFSPRAADLRLMTGLSDAGFWYLDLHPPKGPTPAWRQDWRSTAVAPYPEAIRLSWEGAGQVGEEVVPIRAKLMPLSQ